MRWTYGLYFEKFGELFKRTVKYKSPTQINERASITSKWEIRFYGLNVANEYGKAYIA